MKRSVNTAFLHTLNLTRATLGAIVLLAVAPAPLLQAQSADALIDKLVDKGILTVKEAKDLRQEEDAGFDKAIRAKNGMPTWVKQMKLYGDVRSRYEQINIEDGQGLGLVDRNRFRYRMRAGVTASMFDNMEAGFRLSSSEPYSSSTTQGDSISANTTFNNNASRKPVYIDLAYGKWTPINVGGFTLTGTVGKMENPFVTSEMLFDVDYTPEGGALQAGYELSDAHKLKATLGALALMEYQYSPTDPWLLGTQVRWDGKYGKRPTDYAWESSLGLSWFGISGSSYLTNNPSLVFDNSSPGLAGRNVPNNNAGNSRDLRPVTGANGTIINPYGLMYKYAPFVADASITYNLRSMPLYKGVCPLKLAGEFMVNPGAGPYTGGGYYNGFALPGLTNQTVQNKGWWVGVTLGKADKRGTWEISYRYQYLEGDAWWDALPDSDYPAFYYTDVNAGTVYTGTNIKGHIFKGTYALYDSLHFTVKYYLTEQIIPSQAAPPGASSHVGRLQVDMLWKF